jgi:hypothetical protein
MLVFQILQLIFCDEFCWVFCEEFCGVFCEEFCGVFCGEFFWRCRGPRGGADTADQGSTDSAD